MGNIIKYNSFEDVLAEVIKTEDDISFFKMILSKHNTKIQPEDRAEYKFFELFQSIVNSREVKIKLKLQYVIDGFGVDGAIINNYENNGEFNNGLDYYSEIIIFEFDENYHKYQKEKDDSRMDHIIKYLKENLLFDVVTVYRIPEDKSNLFLLYAIPYFGCVESSYSCDYLTANFEYIPTDIK